MYLVVVQERDLAVPRELAARVTTQGSRGELWSWTLEEFEDDMKSKRLAA